MAIPAILPFTLFSSLALFIWIVYPTAHWVIRAIYLEIYAAIYER